MYRLITLVAFIVLFASAILLPAQAQEETPRETQPAIGAPLEGQKGDELVIATKVAPPFAFRGPDSEWTGISIQLLSTIADELDIAYRLEEATLDDMIDGVANGRFGGAIAAMSITPGREEQVDFTFPFYSTGLGIAVNPDVGGGWLRVARNFFTAEFLLVLAGLSAVLLLAGAAAWFFERRGNEEEFKPDLARGLGDGFWWAAVTMTTVGYGDKSPRTLGGRIVGLIWMFTAMLIVASFTAAIAASLTVGQLGGKVRDAADLADVRVGVIDGSSGAEELSERNIRTRPFDDVEAGFEALKAERIDAFVHDRPLLQFMTLENYQGEIRVLPDPIGRQDYAIALPPGSELREPVNRALLARVRSPEWGRVVEGYLGADD